MISLDEVRAELEVEPTDDQGQVAQEAQERCRELLRAKRSFAFNATNLIRQTRQRWINLFADYDARIEIVYLEPAMFVVLKQNRQRERAIPERVLWQLAEKMEPPTWAEAHSLLLD